MMNNSIFYSCEDVQKLLNVSKSKSYSIIRQMNEELEGKGFLVIPGKIPKKFFAEHVYGEV